MIGLVQSVGPAASVTPGQSALGLVVGFALLIGPFVIGALGGGDVKLLAASGAWLGPAATLEIFVIAAIVAMLVAIVQAISQRRSRAVLGSTVVVAMGLLHARQLGATHAAETARAGRAIDRPLPYAVPVLIAMLLMLARSWN